jgi:replicative superfamily II helicase
VQRQASLLQLMALGIQDANVELHQVVQLGRLWEALGGLTDDDKSAAVVFSALAYEVAGSSANSAAVIQKFSKHLDADNDIVLLCVQLLLSRRLLRLRSTLSGATADVYAALGLLKTCLLDAIEEFTEYLLSGNVDRLNSARLTLDDASDLASAEGSIRDYLISKGLRRLTTIIATRSIWTLLGDEASRSKASWQRYLQLLARGQGRDLLEGRSITELWPSQRRAIEKGLLERKVSSLSVRMPTSSGKTRVAELAIVKTLIEEPDCKIVYIAPFRALANEILGSFRRLLGDLGFSVASVTGAYEYDDLEESLFEEADVSVLTPERLDLLLRINRAALERIRLVIVDEGQILEADGRGIKTELLLTRLRHVLPEARFLVASAIVGEDSLVEISRWLAAKGADTRSEVAVTRWRPSLQQVARFVWQGSGGFIRFVDENAAPGDVRTFLPGVIRKRDIVYVKESTRRRNTRPWPLDKSDTAAELAIRLSRLGPVRVYVVQPQWTMSVATRIDELITIEPDARPDWWGNIPDGPGRAEQIATDWLPDERVKHLLAKGVAIHHGDLPEALKDAVERDAREGRFRIIVATGTLASGVNIPIRTVIFHSCIRYDKENRRSVLLPAADYWNIAGRAGRAGFETEGLVVHIIEDQGDEDAFSAYLEFPKRGLPLTSKLLDLATRLQRRLVSVENAANILDPEILALAAEELTCEEAEEQIEAAIGDSLGAIQETPGTGALRELTGVMKRQAQVIFERAPSIDRRVAFAQTGLTSSECAAIGLALENSPEIRTTLIEGSLDQHISALLPILLNVGPMLEIGATTAGVIEAITSWLSAEPIKTVVAKLMDNGLTEERAQRVIDRYFRYYIPWYISACIRIAASVFEDALATYSLISRYVPAMIRCGVPTVSSCYAMALGMPTRTIAVAVGDSFDLGNMIQADFAAFRKWVNSMERSQFSERFQIYGAFLQDVCDTMHASGRREAVIDSLRNDEIIPRDVTARIITNREAQEVFRNLRIGDELSCVRSYVDLLDRNAVEIAKGKTTLAQLREDDGRILAAELDGGRSLLAEVRAINVEDFTLSARVH